MDRPLIATRPALSSHAHWWVLAAGLAGLYVPSLFDLARGLWANPEQAHGPVVLAVTGWLIYRQWPALLAAQTRTQPTAWGWLVLAVGLVGYALGRSQDILIFEVGSAIWMLAAVALLFVGPRGLRIVAFPLFFMLFMIPLPGPLVDSVTMPMKMAVSFVADQVLHALGYPIARTGVILQVGPYQLLVADACAGLHTLFSLEAMGLLYLNLVRHDSWFRNVALAILIVPISFIANVIRVMVLSLITYHWGDDAGQGFLHGFAGIVLFVSALLLIVAADSALHMAVRARRQRRAQRQASAGVV